MGQAQLAGSVKRLVGEKGFGFIQTADGTEYFFHRTAVQGGRDAFDHLREGSRVRFVLGENQGKGPRAEQVETA